MLLRTAFVRTWLNTVCVGLEAPDGVDAVDDERLHPEERRLALSMVAPRRASFALGRVALHEAMNRLSVSPAPVLPSSGGEPLLPRGVAGSISHKGRIAVAIAALSDAERVGVDLELLVERRHDLSRRVLSAAERDRTAHLSARELAREVLVRFSLKEAAYKALYPWVQRYVAFREVEVEPAPGGTAAFRFALNNGEGPFFAEGHWHVMNGLTAAPAVLSLVHLRRGGLAERSNDSPRDPASAAQERRR